MSTSELQNIAGFENIFTPSFLPFPLGDGHFSNALYLGSKWISNTLYYYVLTNISMLGPQQWASEWSNEIAIRQSAIKKIFMIKDLSRNYKCSSYSLVKNQTDVLEA